MNIEFQRLRIHVAYVWENFELKEELVEMPSCKHIFHLDCIHIWLYSHTTCPLCRSSVFISSTKTSVDDNDHPNSSQTSPV
ncbi:hypothetical protein YC2023_017141 [Brassica napus]|uniref:RING-type E3 ubiquitin transferase n=1 Tax=Brassica napus TaxID=3708 RepID=A0A816KA97_BRANA|nr:unnamed protein product [Brassica napus]